MVTNESGKMLGRPSAVLPQVAPKPFAATSVFFNINLPPVSPAINEVDVEADFGTPLSVQEAAARCRALAASMPHREYVDIDLPSDL